MGRHSDYKYSTFKKEISSEEIKNKIGKENLSVKEIAVYLAEKYKDENSSNQTHENKRTYTERTIRNYIRDLCEKSNGILNENDFRENPNDNKSKYVLKPEIHDLILTIFDSAYFDGRKNDRKLRTRKDLFDNLVKNIEYYMSENDKKTIKSSYAYLNACLESKLTERLNIELSALLRNLYHTDPVIRFIIMKCVIEELTRLEKWTSNENARIEAYKIACSHGKFEKAIFNSFNLEDYLINILAYRINKIKPENESYDENIPIETLYLAQGMYNINLKEGAVKELLDEVDENISNYSRFKEIDAKAKQILDFNNKYEELIYINLMKMCRIYFVAPSISKDEYENTVEFIESIIAKDKWDLLNELYQLGNINDTK